MPKVLVALIFCFSPFDKFLRGLKASAHTPNVYSKLYAMPFIALISLVLWWV